MNWQQTKLKYVARFEYGDALPQAESERVGSIEVFGSNGPYSTFNRSNTCAPTIVIGRKGSYGKVNWSDEPCFASDTTFFIDRTTTKQDLRWLFYLLQTLDLDKGTNEAAVPGLSREHAYDKEVFVPSLAEQRSIAQYLDLQTAKIDTLITAKQRLLKLLTERRRALITHAVTRGLNPDAPMRDSGLDFLGDVPNHWEVINLKFLGRVKSGVAKGRQLGDLESVFVPYLRVANVQDGYLNLSDISTIEVLSEEIPTFSLKKGDVLMNEGGDADKLGRGAIWDGSIDPCLHQNHVFAVRCFAVEPTWLTTVTGSDYAKAYFESRSKQSTNLASISSTNIQELPVVMPPEQEQTDIMEYLRLATTKLDRLREITEHTLFLLHERRIALISAAVTGQIRIQA